MRRRGRTVKKMLVLVTVIGVVGGCSPSRSEPPDPAATGTPEPEAVVDYEAGLAAISFDGVPERPLYWEDVDLPRTAKETALLSAVREWVALNHSLTYAPAPRPEEDLALLYVLAAGDWAGQAASRHGRGPSEPNPDPWVGPQWIRVLEVDQHAEPPTVMLCFDQGFYTRESQGGGVEVFRDETRALLREFSLVREQVPGLGPRWQVSHERWYAGDDYPEPNTGPDRECKEWANHDLTDVPDS